MFGSQLDPYNIKKIPGVQLVTRLGLDTICLTQIGRD